MLSHSLLIIFLIALVVVAMRARRRTADDSVAVLRHTIAVNLEILESELVELSTIAVGAKPSAASEEASRLLQSARTIAESARLRLYAASGYELEEILGHVFAAMMQSTEARKLLNAQRRS